MFAKRSLHCACAFSLGLLEMSYVIPRKSNLKTDFEANDNKKLSLLPGIISPKLFAHPPNVLTADRITRSGEFVLFEDRLRTKYGIDFAYKGYASPILMEFANWYLYFDTLNNRQLYKVLHFKAGIRIQNNTDIQNRLETERGIKNNLSPGYSTTAAINAYPPTKFRVLGEGPWKTRMNFAREAVSGTSPRFEELIMVTGPLYVHGAPKLYHPTLGTQLPTHFFMIIFGERDDCHGCKELFYQSYLMPNSMDAGNEENFDTDIEVIEDLLQHRFLTQREGGVQRIRKETAV